MAERALSALDAWKAELAERDRALHPETPPVSLEMQLS
jgi:hypothetical protein